MKNLSKILILIVPIIVSKVSFSQTASKIEKKYYGKVIYQEIPNKKLFDILGPKDTDLQEKSLEKTNKSISKLPDSITNKYSLEDIKLKYEPYQYKNNRSRIYFDSYYNKKKRNKKVYLKKGMSLPCECYIKKDTLTIGSSFGFFGGFGIASQINGDKFKNYFWEYSDVEYLKLKKEDTVLKKSIEIDGIYQKMILEQKPKVGEVLTGYFSLYSKPYYTNETETNIHSEYYFKCLVYQVAEKDDD